MSSKETKPLEEYVQLLEQTISLSLEKEELMQRVIDNYGSHRVAVYLKKIKVLEDDIRRMLAQIEEFRGSC